VGAEAKACCGAAAGARMAGRTGTRTWMTSTQLLRSPSRSPSIRFIMSASGEPRLTAFNPRNSAGILLSLVKRVQVTLQDLRKKRQGSTPAGMTASRTRK
jgi:hypothetical protein